MSNAVVYMTVGLPGSGKSTWAREFALEIDAVEVTKDVLRTQVCQTLSRSAIERATLRKQEAIVRIALSAARPVIVHDTNFNPWHLDRLSAIASEYDAEVVTVDFTDVPLEECVRRDALRTAPVGRAVIERMHSEFLAPAS